MIIGLSNNWIHVDYTLPRDISVSTSKVTRGEEVAKDSKVKLFDKASKYFLFILVMFCVHDMNNLTAQNFCKLYSDRYVMEDYDSKPAFSSFLPAVAGVYGIPVWSFYVNRGQGVASFGFQSKQYPILEFNAANKAYQLTPYIGFRTFLKGSRHGKEFQTEPFTAAKTRNLESDESQDDLPKRIMYIGPNEMEIKEEDSTNGITTSVKYIVLPEESFGALVRRANITNSGDSPLKISALDGLAKLEPVGGQIDWALKNMGRTLEGWMGVYQ